jgi:hypothetical protein
MVLMAKHTSLLVSCPINYNRFDRSDSSKGVGAASAEAMHSSDPPLVPHAAPRGLCRVPKVAPRLRRYFWDTTLVACGLGIAACSGATGKVETPSPASDQPLQVINPVASVTEPQEAPPSPTWTSEEAHRLLTATAACWLGGVWSDAEGVDEATRTKDAERRCHQLVERIYGTDDQARYERLRAVDPVEVSELKTKILAVARIDTVDHAREQQLGALLDAMANAERESMIARRAGDRVKKDVAGDREHIDLTADEMAAVDPLNDARAFEALLSLDAGELTPEARALAILCAMDRMETARGLTKHLKVYALARPFAVLFSTPAPAVPTDARRSLVDGTWLSYMTSVAAAAGHPVVAAAKTPLDRELLAWGGALEGLADKLQVEAKQMSNETALKRISEAIVRRIDAEYRASEATVVQQSVRKRVPAARSPSNG